MGEMLDYVEWQDRDDGEKSRIQQVMSTLLEGISDYDMKWAQERIARAAIHAEKEALEREVPRSDALRPRQKVNKKTLWKTPDPLRLRRTRL